MEKSLPLLPLPPNARFRGGPADKYYTLRVFSAFWTKARKIPGRSPFITQAHTCMLFVSSAIEKETILLQHKYVRVSTFAEIQFPKFNDSSSI